MSLTNRWTSAVLPDFAGPTTTTLTSLFRPGRSSESFMSCFPISVSVYSVKYKWRRKWQIKYEWTDWVSECVRPVSNPENEIHNSLHFCTMNIEHHDVGVTSHNASHDFMAERDSRWQQALSSRVRVNWCSHFSFFSFFSRSLKVNVIYQRRINFARDAPENRVQG